MEKIIARSRIGFWTAFRTDDASYLNIRADDGATVTVVLSATDVEMLASDADVCHPHARRLANHGRRLDVPLPTPPRGTDEPEPHEWMPREQTMPVERLKAA